LQIIGDVRNILSPTPGAYWFIRNNQSSIVYQQTPDLTN